MTLYKDRIKRVSNHMRQHGIDIMIIPSGINFRWLFGVLEEPSERLLVGIIDNEGSSKILAPSFEVDRMKRLTGVKDCIGWNEEDDPFTILKEVAFDAKSKTVGIEPKMWFFVYDEIVRKAPDNNYINAASILSLLRAIKDEKEKELLLKASQRSGKVIVETLNELHTGISENEVQKILQEKLIWGTNERSFQLVQFGSNSALPHYQGGNKKLKKDETVLIDAGGTIDNYWGDITITVVFGKASKRFREVFDIVFEANNIGKTAVEEEMLPCDIDKSVRSYIAKEGYGKYFTHRTGHGLGLEVHEHPYIFGNNKNKLVEGNVFTIEPGIYLNGEFGVRIEDNIIKVEEGIKTSKIPRYEILEI
ncbi:MAG: M24 family metallopeptidase [Candidatus Hodarchaeales archaeon]